LIAKTRRSQGQTLIRCQGSGIRDQIPSTQPLGATGPRVKILLRRSSQPTALSRQPTAPSAFTEATVRGQHHAGPQTTLRLTPSSPVKDRADSHTPPANSLFPIDVRSQKSERRSQKNLSSGF